MSQDLGDIINTLWCQIRDSKKIYDRELCVSYLRSTCQKHLFAEKRLESLKSRIEEYEQNVQDTGEHDPFCIEMDFDHCILSLRSSLEHLAQLINAIISLGLTPRVTEGMRHVTLKNVTEGIGNNDLLKNNEYLSSLSSYLRGEMEKDWYTDLHDLRITMFHDQFGRLPRTSTYTPKRKLLGVKFLLPNGTVKRLESEADRDITSYCEGVVRKVGSVLGKSFDLLSKYLTK